MPKTKTKKANKPTKTKGNIKLYKTLTVVFAATTICLAGIAVFFFVNRKTDIEQRKIQVAETFIKRYFESDPLVSDEVKPYTITRTTAIGLSQDNDLYVEFQMMREDSDYIPEYVEKGVMYFQCGDTDGKIIGTDNPSACSIAVTYEDPKYISEELRNEIKELSDAINARVAYHNARLKELYGPGNYTEEEDGGVSYSDENLTEEQLLEVEKEHNRFAAEVVSDESLYEKSNKLYEEVWNYL